MTAEQELKLAALTATVEIVKVKGSATADQMIDFAEKVYRSIRKLQKED
jgi:hypothetical protein